MHHQTTVHTHWFRKQLQFDYYLPRAEKTAPLFLWASLALAIIGLIQGLAFAPADYQQGNSFRIIYIHVPSAIFSTCLYIFMALFSLFFLIWHARLLSILGRSLASLGAMCTFVTLVTGAIWGRPTWGTWWTWDIRLTSELILFFFYVGYLALDHALEDRQTADNLTAVLAIVGITNVILVKVSVYFFNSIHQKSTLFAEGGPRMPSAMLTPLLFMIAAYGLFTLGYVLKKSTSLIYKEKLLEHYLNN